MKYHAIVVEWHLLHYLPTAIWASILVNYVLLAPNNVWFDIDYEYSPEFVANFGLF